MQSNGEVMSAPAIARAAGFPDVITGTLSGTSFDVSLVVGGGASLAAQTTIVFELDMHYLGQTHTVAVPLPPAVRDGTAGVTKDSVRAAFEAAYQASFNRLLPGLGARIVNLRTAAVGPSTFWRRGRMPQTQVDVVVLGSGIGGSTVAAILARQGLRTAIVGSALHPRFALGESTIGETSFLMRILAARYDVPELGLARPAPTAASKRRSAAAAA